jgi:hypothetical protein
MSYVAMDARPVDFILCQYGSSKNLFRGPKKSCKHSYGVCLGGADTFGGKVPDPFSAMLERKMGMPILNLGAQHSGAGFYTEDDAIHEIIENAQVIFIEAPSVVNQSNPFYRVHPRRNDRFVTALGPLYDLFPGADFVECHFTKHLIAKLITIDAARADIVFRALQDELVRNLTIMRARWRAKTVVHWYKTLQASQPQFEFPVADLIGFYPELYNAVSQVQDQIVSIQFALSHMNASQRDHQQIGQRLLDAIA